MRWPSGEPLLEFHRVLRRVHTDGGVVGDADGDRVAVLQHAQLFESFDAFEASQGQLRELLEQIRLLGIKPEVAEAGLGADPGVVDPAFQISCVGQRRARKIQRTAVAGEDDLHLVGVIEILRRGEWGGQRCHRGVALDQAGEGSNLLVGYQRLIRLDIDDLIRAHDPVAQERGAKRREVSEVARSK